MLLGRAIPNVQKGQPLSSNFAGLHSVIRRFASRIQHLLFSEMFVIQAQSKLVIFIRVEAYKIGRLASLSFGLLKVLKRGLKTTLSTAAAFKKNLRDFSKQLYTLFSVNFRSIQLNVV